MRRIFRKRHLHLPRSALMSLLLLSIIIHPDACMSSTGQSAGTQNAAIDDAAITAPSGDFVSGEISLAEKIRMQVVSIAEKNKEIKEKAKNARYDASVYNTLSLQGLSEEHIVSWQKEHPLSALNQLDTLSPSKQRKVASTASFIKKVNPSLSHKTAWREACALVYYSVKYGVPADLSVSVAKTESRFNPSAQSKAGALGVMQVMWKVHNSMLRAKGIAPTREHMFDPERGVEAGVLILSRYIAAYGTVQKALNRYYGGLSSSYLKKVKNNMAMLQRHSEDAGY